jgi:putative phage-type endonuclease
MIIQESPEWHAVRCGKATASRIADVVAKTKTGWGASRANYAAELIAERLTGFVAPSFQNDAMRWGVENEAGARDAYAHRFGLEVVQTSFVDHPEIAMSGASPDGLVSSAGLLEVKCPNTATHLETLITGTVPGKYVTQMAWQMACCGRDWCDFSLR